jgi:hypothetical protein
MSHTERIRQLNDQCRTSLSGCRLMITQGVSALDQTAAVLKAVRDYSNFRPDNDPYGEHDFGTFIVAGHRLFWKFDYYNSDMQMASLDPADETITARVLTVMLAEEY